MCSINSKWIGVGGCAYQIQQIGADKHQKVEMSHEYFGYAQK